MSNPSELELFGTIDDTNKSYIKLLFMPCRIRESKQCAAEEEVRDFLSKNFLTIIGGTNFIDMKHVVPDNETL